MNVGHCVAVICLTSGVYYTDGNDVEERLQGTWNHVLTSFGGLRGGAEYCIFVYLRS